MMLLLPLVGKLTAIAGQRNMLLSGILIQLLGRICMMCGTSWVPYASVYLIQSIGGGFYSSSAYVNMSPQ